MTNTDVIIQNESKNDGTAIHLYFNSSIDTWAAYGVSAYRLKLFESSYGSANMQGFSSDLQLPYTLANRSTVTRLQEKAGQDMAKETTYLQFKMEGWIDMGAYRKFAERLRRYDEQNSGNREVLTPVGDNLPKDTYINDGMSSFERNIKRIGDFILAFFCLIVFSPLFLICWLAVRLEDGECAIFKQERIGRFGRPFYIYKFRSMRIDAEASGPQLSGGENDTRLTRVGKFIRAHHLDELPQLWNVFCGDMAFIGPRPERKFYIDQIMEYDPRYTYLYQIRPGVTSYATLYNGYTDTMEKMLRRLEYDLYYLGHRSWWFDFKILWNTFCSIVLGKKF